MSSLVSSGRDVSPVAGRLGSERREGDPGGEGSVWESRRGRDSGQVSASCPKDQTPQVQGVPVATDFPETQDEAEAAWSGGCDLLRGATPPASLCPAPSPTLACEQAPRGDSALTENFPQGSRAPGCQQRTCTRQLSVRAEALDERGTWRLSSC
ncbi:unnamed protein product [Rangifer tarandus platyrhynchus]|uniref:Uncharacterized protein n=1 Tax=Rangifer tarandus platyrhynchus TaxID=3082113 RepID=A0AC59YWD2_RANTA